MNKGVAAATGDYCIFMNSGDTFASEDVLEKIFKGELSLDDAQGLTEGSRIGTSWWFP